MISWDYNPENYGKQRLIPAGKYKARIEEATEKQSKSGKQMIELVLKVSGENSKIWYYLVFDASDAEKKEITDNKLGSIWDSFDIPVGDFNLENWKGKVGAVVIKNKPDQNEEMRAEVSYFIKREKQKDLPPWQEGRSGIINPEMADFNNGAEFPF